jgi:hypothetical protein
MIFSFTWDAVSETPFTLNALLGHYLVNQPMKDHIGYPERVVDVAPLQSLVDHLVHVPREQLAFGHAVELLTVNITTALELSADRERQ